MQTLTPNESKQDGGTCARDVLTPFVVQREKVEACHPSFFKVHMVFLFFATHVSGIFSPTESELMMHLLKKNILRNMFNCQNFTPKKTLY